MKPKILKLSSIVLLFLFIGAACQKDEIEYADESIEISSSPGIGIYKTNEDYINNISLQLTEEGKLNAIPGFTQNDSRISVSDGKIKQNFRWRLRSGYIVDKDVSRNQMFTNISIQEYVDWNTENNVAGWPDSLIKPRIIDKNPFTEFYYLDGLNKTEIQFTLGEINEMIENGTLETIFTKQK